MAPRFDLMRIASILGGLGTGFENPNDFRTPPFVPNQTFGGSFQNQQFPDPNSFPQPEPYQPVNDMQMRFQQLMDSFPQRDPNPSGWRRLGAVLTGLGGENAAESMQLSNMALNMPFYNKVQDWSTQINPALRGMESERLFNQNMMTQSMQDRRLDEQERYNRERIRMTEATQARLAEADKVRAQQGQERIEIARLAQELANWKARNPGFEFISDRKTGRVIAVNKLDPTDARPTSIEHGKMSDNDKLMLGLDNDKELVRLRGEIESGHITQRGTEARETKQTPSPANDPNRTTSHTQDRARIQNRLFMMSVERDDLYKWVDPNTGSPKSNTPPDVRQQIADYLNSGSTNIQSGTTFRGQGIGTNQNQPPAQNRPANRPAPPNAPRVRQADGAVMVWDNETNQYGYMPRANVTKAKLADGRMRFEVIR